MTIAASVASAASLARVATATVFFVNGFAFASWVPHIPTVKSALDLTTAALGLALLGPAVGALIAMPLSGAFINRWGSRNVTAISALLYCISTGALVWMPSLSLLVIALLAFGAANGAMDVAMNAHGVAVEKALGRPIMSSLHAMFSIGGLVGALGAVVALWGGMAPGTHMIAAAGIGLALAGAMMGLLLPRTADATRHGRTFAIPRGPLVLLGALAFFVLMAEGAIADWSALYFREVLQSDADTAGLGYAGFSLAMAAGRLAGDRLVVAWGRAVVLRAGAVLAASGLGVALWRADPLLSVVGFACAGLGLANCIPLLFSAAGHSDRASAGSAIAAVATAGYGGFLAGPPLIGFIADQTGLRLALGILVLLMAMVASAAFAVRR